MILQTPRLTLRPFRNDDVDDALSYRNDPEFARFLPHIPQPFTRQDAEAFVVTNISEPWTQSPTFAVVRTGVLIGTISFEVDANAAAAMLGYAIGRRWWGQGLTTEAAKAAMAWAIGAFSLHRVWASTDIRHRRSQRVLEKLGMTPTHARTLSRTDRNGVPIDEIVYAFEVHSSGD
ncbi:MAG: GNAT family N-acetyltransferase [Myxococcota bacterium]